MLIIHGIPIKNCLDFYDHFDIAEILEQPQVFVLFARNHLNFHPLNAYCLDVFERAASGRKLFECVSEMSFWQGRMSELRVTEKVKSVVVEAYAYYKKRGKDSADSAWEKKFVMAAAATILAGKSFTRPEEKTASRKNNGEIALQLDKDTIVLTPGHAYDCPYHPDIPFREGMKLSTVTLLAESGFTSTVTLWLSDHEKHDHDPVVLHSGERLYINVCDNSVVKILPNEIECSKNILRRDMKAGCVTCNGERTGIPVDASSFACLEKGKYLYIQKNKAVFLGIDAAMIPGFLLSAKMRYVEVAVKGSEYYLLSPSGIVKTRRGTPTNMQAYYPSLQKALT